MEAIITLILLNLIGAVLLLLWATHFVNHSIVQAFGGKMRTILSQSTSNRFTAFATGFGITALLQSSTATTLMTASFVSKNMMGLRAAIAIIIGADLSTTILAQILSFDLSWLSPALFAIGGSISLRKSNSASMRAYGQILVGLGLMLLALGLIREAAAPMKSSEILQAILAALSHDAFMAVLFSALITVLIHSSLATILFYASLASQGVISIDLGLLLVIGANIGGSLIPYIATHKDGIDKKRLMSVNIFMRVCIGVVALIAYPFLTSWIEGLMPDAARAIVFMHTGFNLALTLTFLPLVTTLARKANYYMKRPKRDDKSTQQSYLDETYLDRPSLALSSAVRETLRMADMIQDMTDKAFTALKSSNTDLLDQAHKLDDQLDKIFKKVTFYLTRLNQDILTEQETAQYNRIMSFATNLEHSGDIVQHSLTKTVEKKIKLQDDFSQEGWEEIKDFYVQVMGSIKTAQSVFISQSLDLSEEMIRTKKYLKEIELISRRNHFNRISNKNRNSIVTTGIHIDLLRDLGRINSCVTSIAYETINITEEQENQG